MIDQARGSFRTAGSGQYAVNVADMQINPGGGNQSMWTAGATLIDSVSLTPALNQKWKILALAVKAQLGYFAGLPTFGKFGRIVAGLLMDPLGPDPSPTNGGLSAATPIPFVGGGGTVSAPRPLPNDPSLMAELWNPTVDAMPPSITPQGIFFPPVPSGAVSATLSISTEKSLTLPRAVIPGTQIGIGIWLLQSLLGAPDTTLRQWGLAIFQATYAVTYDNGS